MDFRCLWLPYVCVCLHIYYEKMSKYVPRIYDFFFIHARQNIPVVRTTRLDDMIFLFKHGKYSCTLKKKFHNFLWKTFSSYQWFHILTPKRLLNGESRVFVFSKDTHQWIPAFMALTVLLPPNIKITLLEVMFLLIFLYFTKMYQVKKKSRQQLLPIKLIPARIFQ